MPRIRYIKPDFFSDEDLCSYPFETRLTFAGLWCYADKAGRLEYRPKYLKAMLFPYDDVDVEKQIEMLISPKPFLVHYSVEGKDYLQIKNWRKHQRPHHTEKESNYPPPQGSLPQEKVEEKRSATAQSHVREILKNLKKISSK